MTEEQAERLIRLIRGIRNIAVVIVFLIVGVTALFVGLFLGPTLRQLIRG